MMNSMRKLSKYQGQPHSTTRTAVIQVPALPRVQPLASASGHQANWHDKTPRPTNGTSCKLCCCQAKPGLQLVLLLQSTACAVLCCWLVPLRLLRGLVPVVGLAAGVLGHSPALRQVGIWRLCSTRTQTSSSVSTSTTATVYRRPAFTTPMPQDSVVRQAAGAGVVQKCWWTLREVWDRCFTYLLSQAALERVVTPLLPALCPPSSIPAVLLLPAQHHQQQRCQTG
jgi:hypothetical protein